MCEENVPLAESPGVWADVSCRSRAVGSSVAGATVDMTVDDAVIPSVSEESRRTASYFCGPCLYVPCAASPRALTAQLLACALYNAARAGWAPCCLSRSQTDL